MEDRDKREGWLRELKVGDKVIVNRKLCSPSIQIVDNITPTGRIIVNCIQYNSSGMEIGGYRAKTLSKWIQTEEDKINEHLKFEKNKDYLRNINWDSLNHETVEQIYNIVKGENKD